MSTPTPLTITPQHYWPGADIPFPLPANGISLSFDNYFVKNLPTNGGDPGYEVRPPGAPSASYDVLWHMVGEGKWVDFWCKGMGDQGPAIFLYERAVDGSSWAYAPMPDDGSPYGGGGFAASAGSPGYVATDGSYQTAAALRVFMKAGIQYVLVVVSFGQSATPDPTYVGPGTSRFDQAFYMEVSYTPLALPDFKSNAWDVIIPSDGATYSSTPLLNANFTSSAEDPQGAANIFATAWWKYIPTTNTVLTLAFATIPEGSVWIQCAVYKQQTDGTLIQLAELGGGTNTFTVPAINANDVIFIQMGGTNRQTYHQPQGQKYQLQVTGAKSAVQTQGPLAPDNDLRPNAIVVSVSSDGNTYLSDDVTLTYATPGAIGTTGPYITDPEAPPLYQTAWWSYTPYITGSATFRAHSTNDTAARIEILDGSLNVLGVTGMSQDLVFTVNANHTYYIVLGTAPAPAALSASFSLVGPMTAGSPPINDLRPHAITVAISNSGDTYLSTNTQLDFATPVAVSSGGVLGPTFPVDPEASPLYQTAWWIYKPLSDGQASIKAHSDPADDASVKLMVLRDLTPLATVDMGKSVTHSVQAGQTYYYVLGTTGQAFASASFAVKGTSTRTKDPATYTGPWSLNLLMPDRSWKTIVSGT